MTLTQIFLQGLAQGIGAGFAAIGSFLVMRYFPKIWEALEKIVKAGIKEAKSETIKEPDHARKLG